MQIKIKEVDSQIYIIFNFCNENRERLYHTKPFYGKNKLIVHVERQLLKREDLFIRCEYKLSNQIIIFVEFYKPSEEICKLKNEEVFSNIEIIFNEYIKMITLQDLLEHIPDLIKISENIGKEKGRIQLQKEFNNLMNITSKSEFKKSLYRK